MVRLGTSRLRHGHFISFVAFTPDGKRLISQGMDGVRMWETATGKQLAILPPSRAAIGRDRPLSDGNVWPPPRLHRLMRSISGTRKAAARFGALGNKPYVLVRFSPDGKLLAASENTRRIELWDMTSRTLVTRGRQTCRRSLSWPFPPIRRRLLTRGGDGKYRLGKCHRAGHSKRLRRETGKASHSHHFDEPTCRPWDLSPGLSKGTNNTRPSPRDWMEDPYRIVRDNDRQEVAGNAIRSPFQRENTRPDILLTSSL